MKRFVYICVAFLALLFLSACVSSQATFTPQVVEIPTATKVEFPTVIPTSSSGELPTESPTVEVPAEPTPTLEPTETPQMKTVSTFPDANRVYWAEIASGFTRPVGMASYKGDTFLIYILDQNGYIWVIENGTLSNEPFLDLTNKTTISGNERGLLGMALDPNFGSNGFFYLDYTNFDGNTVIARYHAQNDRRKAIPDSEQILFTVNQPYSNHNGGNLLFGPDGFLYIGMGDGGSQGDPDFRAQNNFTLLGKMLRIAVQGQDMYAIPSDNPFVNGGGSAEIWAVGLRNPWRFSFDRLTGDLWIGDVGQNNWEEIDFLPAGATQEKNFGWSYREGTHAYKGDPPNAADMIDPVFEYNHGLGCSVTGGYVYRGENLPDWYGVYLFGDYCTGIVWGLLPLENGEFQSQQLFSTGENISSFGEDVNGELYLISHNGSVYQLRSK